MTFVGRCQTQSPMCADKVKISLFVLARIKQRVVWVVLKENIIISYLLFIAVIV